MVALSAPAFALVGVVIGGLLSAATALAAPWMASALATRQFREELQWRRLDELAALMDDAGLALERFHWSLRSAIDALDDGGTAPKRWRRHEAEVREARERASSLGSRLAIRLGPARECALVGVYDGFQGLYRELGEILLTGPPEGLDAAALRQRLEERADHDEYFFAACSKRQELGQQVVSGARAATEAGRPRIRQVLTRRTGRG